MREEELKKWYGTEEERLQEARWLVVESMLDAFPNPPEAGLGMSFYPFRKFGFIIDEASLGNEFRPERRMSFCNLQ